MDSIVYDTFYYRKESENLSAPKKNYLEALILDESFKTIYTVDIFESFIWTERYVGAGNFEVYAPMSDQMSMILDFITTKRALNVDIYLWMRDADQLMVIEDSQITTEFESGNRIIISGRSLESILDRRIVWKQTILDGNLQNAIKKLLNENAINPEITARKITNLVFKDSTDTKITSLNIRAQYTGDNLYDTIYAICSNFGIGFRITLSDANQFIFELYAGEDRSYDQTTNPYVVFSPKFENILNSSYYESTKTIKNVALVAGEDEGNTRKTRIVGSGSGMARRELYVDARDIQSETDSGKLTDAQYNAQLDQRGSEKLSENTYTKIFEGEIETTQMYIYGRDFFKGDVVQILNEYGIAAKVRIMEIMRSQDTNGYNLYPTFSVLV